MGIKNPTHRVNTAKALMQVIGIVVEFRGDKRLAQRLISQPNSLTLKIFL
jgi:hypothetical protein